MCNLKLRPGGPGDAPLLAEMNRQLIQDEGHWRSLSAEELESRMKSWLRSDYRAIVFEDDQSEAVGYALFRPDDSGVFLRQFFIARSRRRRGYGRKAIDRLRTDVWPSGSPVTVEVLSHNQPALVFWRAVGFDDYAITLRCPRPTSRSSP